MLRPVAMGRPVLRVMGLACLSAVPCSDGEADRKVVIRGANMAPEGTMVVESVCLPEDRLQAEGTEDSRTVTVTVTALDHDPDNRDTCMGGRSVPLSSPLGDRELIEGLTGDEVAVQRGSGR